MATELFANNAQTTLASLVTAGATSLTVASSAPFPAASTAGGQFRVLIDTELFLVTNVAGATWTVTPGMEGTTQAAHASGAPVTAIVTAAALAAAVAAYVPRDNSAGQVRPVSTALWPFRHDSVWNLPVATTAQFEAATDTRTAALINPTGITAYVNWDTFSHPVTQATLADPVASITDTGDSTRSAITYVPAAAPIAAGTDGHMHIVTPDGRWCHENFGTTRVSSTAYNVSRHQRSDLYGSGVGPASGTRAYGGSAIAGLIRTWEATAGVIRHALALALVNSQLKYTSGAASTDADGYSTLLGYVYPATEQDGDSATAYTGQVPMGSYLGIPGTVDITTLGLSAPGLVVARALQQFGAYVVDRAGSMVIYADPLCSSTFIGSVRGDMNAIRAQLRIVKNNSITTPNGGVFTGDDSNRVTRLAPPLPNAPKVS